MSTLKSESNFDSLINNPLSKIYRLERLKHELNEFYSFRLLKSYRLIVKPNIDSVLIDLVYISNNHYSDFDKSKVIYYEEK